MLGLEHVLKIRKLYILVEGVEKLATLVDI